MQHIQGVSHTLVVRTQAQGVPSADGDGTAMSQWNNPVSGPTRRPVRYLARVNISNVGTSCVLSLYLKDATIAGGGAWGKPVDPSGNMGVLANGQALPVNATYFFVIEDIATVAEVCLVQSSNVGGTPVVTATMAPLIETGAA